MLDDQELVTAMSNYHGLHGLPLKQKQVCAHTLNPTYNVFWSKCNIYYSVVTTETAILIKNKAINQIDFFIKNKDRSRAEKKMNAQLYVIGRKPQRFWEKMLDHQL